MEKMLCKICNREFAAKEDNYYDELKKEWIYLCENVCKDCLKDLDDDDLEDAYELKEKLNNLHPN